ncbi:MAG: glycosyltransferase family 2 protein [Nitrososphaerota archaeon]|nr:glycosyltransferase family 2 protein [Nitrososphaerota archaeon]
MGNTFKVRIILPAINEEKNVVRVIPQIKRNGYKDILVVDGNSVDKTAEYAEKLGAKVIRQKGKGKGNALRQGFEDSRFDFDAVIILDADGSMSPQELAVFVDAIRGGADIAKGSRFIAKGGSKDFSLIRRVGNTLLTFTFNFLFLTRYTDLCYGYMAFSKNAINKLIPALISTGFEIETEICTKATLLGMVVKEVPSFEDLRYSGVSNLNTFRDGTRIMGVILKTFIEGIKK